MSFSNQSNNESTSTLVKLQGNPLNHVLSLKTRWRDTTGQELHKGTAIALLLNKIPKDVIKQAIMDIVEEVKSKKK